MVRGETRAKLARVEKPEAPDKEEASLSPGAQGSAEMPEAARVGWLVRRARGKQGPVEPTQKRPCGWRARGALWEALPTGNGPGCWLRWGCGVGAVIDPCFCLSCSARGRVVCAHVDTSYCRCPGGFR